MFRVESAIRSVLFTIVAFNLTIQEIKKELEKISMTVDSLKLWTEQTLSNGLIDQEEYRKINSQE